MTDSSSSDSTESQNLCDATAGLTGSGNTNRPVKRRASRACQCCRTRKVRCNVVEHGAPCTNCRLDEVECIVTESKRRKKLWGQDADPVNSSRISNASLSHVTAKAAVKAEHRGSIHAHDAASRGSPECDSSTSPSQGSFDGMSLREHEQHVPHLIYQNQCHRISVQDASQRCPVPPPGVPAAGGKMQVIPGPYPLFSQNGYQQRPLRVRLPTYVRPLPARVAPEDEEYLWKKGALAVPAIQLRNELLQAYLDYVHPYMPLLDWQQFVRAVEGNGAEGQTSLLLLQAVMFAGSPYVDMRSLRSAGFTTRKAARKALFQKAKLLYDVDYEIDRITLVQSLLLMTYWYETPDDQKDTWHWMGVAISLAYSIGLNRNPEGSNMNVARKQLWRRIWWSCFVRERLVALAMRRPTRIRAEDYDVPILTLSDFTVEALPENISCISSDCFMARDLDMQRQLAVLCVEEAKLSLCISHVLSTQYSILINNQGVTTTEGNTLTTMILLPKKPESEACNLGACDLELSKWYQGLPEEAAYRSPAQAGIRKRPLFVHRALLHMLYHTTVSALHRPQLLPCGPTIGHAHGIESAVQDTRRKVHASATEITRIARELNECDLVQFLPSTGVTVLLPAIVNHLLIMKTSDGETREASLQGFCDCMRAMRRLSASYAAADYATEFLEAATKKAGIQFAAPGSADVGRKHRVTDLSDLLDVGMRRSSVASSSQLTPPPEQRTGSGANPTASGSFSERRDSLSSGSGVGYTGLAQKLTSFLAYTPPSSDLYDGDSRSRSSASVTPLTSGSGTSGLGSGVAFDWPDATPGIFCDVDADLGDDFESLVDLDGAAGSFFGDGDEAGNAGDFTSDMDWMAEMGEGSKEHGRTGMSVGM